jgi:hypothetical protein
MTVNKHSIKTKLLNKWPCSTEASLSLLHPLKYNYVHTHTHMFMYLYIYIYIYICMYVYVHVRKCKQTVV